MVRTCTGEVWVRSTSPPLSGPTNNVSCMVRAGWSGMKLSASKLSHSASSSGPSATSQPMPTKTSSIRLIRAVIGCTAPTGAVATGSVTSTRSSTRIRASSAS